MKKIKRFLRTDTAFFIILAAVVFFLYAKTINYEFIKYDDDTLITRNINFISNFSNIPKLFTTSCYYLSNYSYYRPVLTLSFAVESILFGNNVQMYHFSNILLFLASIFLMYLFLKHLKQNTTVIKLICILAAVHPIFTSCVAWVPARNDTLLMISICLSFINLINYYNTRKSLNIFLFLLFFAAALFTKENAIVVIPTYALFMYLFKFKFTKQQTLKTTAAMVLILAGYFFIRNISVSSMAVSIFEWQKYGTYILTGTMTYISKFLIPDSMPVMIYDINLNAKPLILNMAFAVFIFVSYRKKMLSARIIIFSLIWLVLWLLPTFLMNDYALLFHRFLIPSLGIALIFGEFTGNLIKKHTILKKYLFVIFATLFCAYFYAARIQADKYAEPAVFWANAYSDAPNYHVACHGFSQRFLEIGDYKKAWHFISIADQYSPNRYLLDMATILLYEEKYEEGEKLLLKAAELNANVKDLVYGNLSKIYIKKNNIKKALEYAQMGYEINSNDIEFSKLMITVYALNGDFKKALDISLELLKYDKKNAQYYYKAAELYELMKDYKNALKYIEEGLKLAPENVQLIEKAKFLKKIKNDSL